jgi:PAS domain S-box-containing protein
VNELDVDRGRPTTNTYQKIVEGLEDAVILLDHQARVLYMNPVAERVLGSSLAEATGKLFWEAAPEVIGTAFRERHERLLMGEAWQILRNCFADGRWYDVLASLTQEDIFLFFHDVTERLEAETARLETEQRLRLLVDGVEDHALLSLDLQGRVASWNSGARRIEGYRAEEILGHDFSIFYPPEDVLRGKPRQALETAVTEGQYREEGWRVRKDGSRFWARVVITAVRDELGNPRGFAKIVHDDTERRRAQVTEERRRLALDSAEIGTWEYFPETGAVVCDARCLAMFGLPPEADVNYEEIIGAIHRDDQQRVRDAVGRALDPATGGRYEAEYRAIRVRDRVERVIAATGKVLFDERRRPSRYLGTVRDVTEVRRTQQALRASEERLRLATSAVHVGTVDYFPSTQELIWDTESKALWGLSPAAEVTVPIWLAGIHPDDRQRQEAAMQRALDRTSGGVLDEQYRVRGRDGVERWISVQAQVFFDSAGRALRFVGMMRDITELRRTQDALAESEERLSLALAAAELGTWDYSPISRRVVVDRRCRELLGIGPEVEVTLELLTAAIGPQDRPRFRELFTSGGANVELEFQVIGLGERIDRWIGATGKLICDARGRGVRNLGAIRDITERHRIDQLHERLTGIFAHDLRSPLSAIVMANQMQLERVELPEDAQEAAGTIARSADRMSRMIQQLMDLTRVRLGGGMLFERERVDLGAVCRDAAAEAEAANPERSVRCDVRGDCVGMFDCESMRRVVSNLVGNALQYGAPDRPIDLLVRGQGTTIVIDVHNEGAPIASDLLSAIFDPFRRASAAAAPKGGHAGLGLGLYITKQIVEGHGGAIEVHSTQEAGTNFTVRLPRSPVANRS